MIRFKKISVDDRELIQSFTLTGERMNCDFSIANIIGWRFLYNSEYAIVDDYLVFRFYADHHLAYMSPIARPVLQDDGTYRVEPCDECSVQVIMQLRDDAIAQGHPFLMLGVCSHMRGRIEEKFPDKFDIQPDRNYFDYIYLREKLLSLSGKHLQSKRNHINKFKSLYPDYEYRPLTPGLIPDCIRLEETWRSQTEPQDDDSEHSQNLSEELRSMTRIFQRWDELGMVGGTLFVGGTMVAFTFGNPVNNHTFDVCVEKADTTYEGSFTMINNEFVRHLPEQYTYINREEDLGDEGLRRSKLSYKPDILLEKFSMKDKHPLQAFEDQNTVKEETRLLWQDTFHDDAWFVQLYFDHVFKSEYNVTCQICGHVVGALQTLPYTLLFHGHEAPSAYISGVSTMQSMREEGIGRSVMRQAHLQMFTARKVFAVLIPADGWLYRWYSEMGYVEKITCTPPPDGVLTMDFSALSQLERSEDCALLHSEDNFRVIRMDMAHDATGYAPTVQPVIGMVRIINALSALQIYAALHPGLDTKIHVRADSDIAANNAYYVISHGMVTRTDRPCAECAKMTIAELTNMVFADRHAVMSMMLN